MIFKATLFAAWASTACAFSPAGTNSHGTFAIRKAVANTGKSASNAFPLYATIESADNILNPNLVAASSFSTTSSTSSGESSTSTTTVAAVPKLAQRWRKSTKQLATLGPASSTKEMIEKLFLAGADVFRLNFSHGSQEQKLELLLIIRVSISSDCTIHISIFRMLSSDLYLGCWRG